MSRSSIINPDVPLAGWERQGHATVGGHYVRKQVRGERLPNGTRRRMKRAVEEPTKRSLRDELARAMANTAALQGATDD